MNRLKSEIKADAPAKSPVKEKEEKQEKPAKQAKVKPPKKPRKQKIPKDTIKGPGVIRTFFTNDKLIRITGLFCILFSVFMLLAFTSYISTWKADDAITARGAANWMGKLGAAISKTFIKNWFGLASYLFIFLFFITGFRMLIKVSIVNLTKSFYYSLFGLIWIPIALALTASLINNSDLLTFSGIFGYEINTMLELLIKPIGTIMLLGFILIAFLIIAFNLSFKGIKTEKNKEPEAEETFEKDGFTKVVYDEDFTTLNTQTRLQETEFETIIPEPETTKPEIRNQKPETKNQKPDDEVELIVEQPKEEIVEEPEEETINQAAQEHFTIDTPYDPTLDLKDFILPSVDLLDEYTNEEVTVQKDELEANKNRILSTLKNYGISIDKIKATIGPTVTLYELIPSPGVRIAKIKSLEDDIALSLSALGIRIIAPMPGKGTIGIEVPNQKPEIVSMRSVLASDKFKNSKYELPIALGKTISNESYIANLTKMPHILMAGATGQGKSVGLNAILTSLLYKKHPSEIKFVLIDPKKVELSLYEKIERHYLAKLPDSEEAIITDTRKVIRTLNSLCIEMDNRYDLLKKAFVRNIAEYNEKFIQRKLNPNEGHKYLPYIILVVDEFADLIMTAGREVETPITRLAQLARAIGIHLIIATQRPSVNIITGTIKANFPTRIAFRVASKIDSRTILDGNGADQLIGRGDMLLATGSELIRLQCAFIDIHEMERLTAFIGDQRAYPEAFPLPEYFDEGEESVASLDPSERDQFFEEAARIMVQSQHGSTSLIQRKLKLGYNRAGRIIDQLEAAGIIGPFEGSKAREVKIKDEASLEQLLRGMKNEE